MTLNSQERRQLARIEAALAADSPDLADDLARMRPRRHGTPGRRSLPDVLSPLLIAAAGVATLTAGVLHEVTALTAVGVLMTMIGPVVAMAAGQVRDLSRVWRGRG